ncbi:MAG: Fe2+-dependent dioxygenase [Beijerinckiaceae bacterium]|nr:Fe2+-dependent dioxygenase [Beijerinckiaceae bacterium]
MLLCIPDLLDQNELAHIREFVLSADWEDGRATGGSHSALVKKNRQLPISDRVALQAGDAILDALARSETFVSAALPLRILPPMFNRYAGSEHFGAHVDGSIRRAGASHVHIRTDLSATLFLSNPEDYDGGELTIETAFGAQSVKLPAGHLVLYPASSLHCVTPVTRGERVASFFWVQSMVRDNEKRSILFDLDQSIQRLKFERGLEDQECLSLSNIYHNLIRQWAQT